MKTKLKKERRPNWKKKRRSNWIN